MLTCPNCGVQNDYNRQRCFRCQAELTPAAPEEWTAAAAADAPAAPASYVAQVALTDDQERFIGGFSPGVGCPVYFWSRAALVETALSVVWILAQAALWLVAKLDHSPGLHWCERACDGFALLTLLALVFGVATGSRMRAQRWTRLPWRDFAHFRQDEARWATLGLLSIAVYIALALSLTPNLAAVP